MNLAKRSECIYFQKSKLRSEANWFILKFYNIAAKRTGSLVILYLKQQQKSELSFFFKTKDKNRKGSIVNYRSFAITSLVNSNCSQIRYMSGSRQIFTVKYMATTYTVVCHRKTTRIMRGPLPKLSVWMCLCISWLKVEKLIFYFCKITNI